MNKGILWSRARAAQVIAILSLLTGFALGWGALQTHRDTLGRIAHLNALRDRIFADVIQTSDALQAWLLDPKSELTRKPGRDAQNDLVSVIDSLQTQFAERAELISAVRSLHTLDTRILEQADSDGSAALAAYHRNFSDTRDKREELLKRLNQQVQMFAADASAAATVHDRLALIGISLILVLSALLIWLQSAAITKPLAGLARILERMGRGDFTQRAEVNGSDPCRELGDGLNRLADNLSALFGQVQRSGLQVNATATRIAATTKEQHANASEIAATSAEIGAASRQISATSRELVQTIDEVSDAAEETAQLANSGQTAIARMESNMRQIMEASGSITAKLTVLSEKTANINSVVTTIARVADQTNLLSLNAAIEAEKAGEYGLGFAVVAMEIRRLADQAAVATYDIEKTVKEMQSAVAAGVMGMDKFSEEVRSGVGEIRQVSTQIARIIQQVQTLTSRFHTVHEGMHAQASGAQEVSDTLAKLSGAAGQTAESLRQCTLAIEQLNEAVGSLQTGVVRFKVEN
jgi:methyl-accepting chemotaxis protein WspA